MLSTRTTGQARIILSKQRWSLLTPLSTAPPSRRTPDPSSEPNSSNGEDKSKGLEERNPRLESTKKALSEGAKVLSDRVGEAWKRATATTTTKAISGPQPDGEEWYSKRVSFWMRRYEDFVGLTEVKAAQERVVRAEGDFSAEQERRRETQTQIREVQEKVKEIHAELEKTYRGEDRYLTLITQEHQILKEEQRLMQEFRALEKREREKFALLSGAVRDSHEKERAQAEKTKYWSVIGSVVGTCIGILGTTVNNRMRMRELRELVTRSTAAATAAVAAAPSAAPSPPPGSAAQAVGLSDTAAADRLQTGIRGHEEKLAMLVREIQQTLSDSKVGLGRLDELGECSRRLEVAGERLRGEERTAAASAAAAAKKSEELGRSLGAQYKSLQGLFSELKRDLQDQTRSVEASLAERHKELDVLTRRGEERDRMIRESFGSLYKNQTSISEVFQERTRRAEYRIKEVHDLIKNIQASAASRRDRETRALENLDSSLVDKIEDALEDHESRMRTAALASGLIVACVTPVAVFAFNKLVSS